MQVEACAKKQGLNVNPADVITVYDALCSCERAKLLEAVLGVEIGQQASDSLSAGRREMLLCRLTADLEVMRNLAPGNALEQEIVEPGDYYKALSNIPWTKALAMHIWLPESLTEQDRYFMLGQVFSAITSGSLSQTLVSAA